MDVTERARLHAALGDEHRLRIVDALTVSDRTFQELAAATRLPGNAAAHHLAVLETAGLITRRTSEGDRRRRYITLRMERLEGLLPARISRPAAVLFVCTHNSARSQFAAALWASRTGGSAESAGTHPADRVHPKAIRYAADFGIDLAPAIPKGYEGVTISPVLVVSVCDRAHEADLPFDAPLVHWSIPDPVAVGTADAFRLAFGTIAERVGRMSGTSRPD